MKRLGAAALLALAMSAPACSDGDDAATPEEWRAFCTSIEALGEIVDEAAHIPEDPGALPAARDAASQVATRAEAVHDAAPPDVREDARRLAEITADLALDLQRFYQQLVDEPDLASDRSFLASFRPLTEDRRDEIDELSGRLRPALDANCGGPTPSTGGEG